MAKPAVGIVYRIGKAFYNYEANTLGNTYGVYQVLPKAVLTATGTAYNDYFVAFSGNDQLTGNAGDDWLVAGNGNNTVMGGDGNDTIVTRTGDYVSQVIDQIPQLDRPYYKTAPALSVKKNGTFSGDIVYDGIGNDFVDTGIGDDQVYMGSGNNQLVLGAGNDKVLLDRLSYDVSTPLALKTRVLEKVKIRLEDGNDTARLGDTLGSIKVDSKSLYFNKQDIGIDFGTISYSKNALGRYVYDYTYKGKLTLYAGSGNDLVVSGAGADIFDLSTGHDSIHAGSGADYIDAGSGDDVVVTGAGADKVFLAEGKDIVYASFGDIISFTAKDKQADVIKIDPLLLTYEEGIIVKSKYQVVTDATGKSTLTLVPIERLGKIMINYPEIGYDQIDLSELFKLNSIKVVDIAKPTTGADLTMSALTGVTPDTYLHYDHNYVSVQDLNKNVKLLKSGATDIFSFTALTDVRKLMSLIPDSDNLIQNKAGYAFIDLPIKSGSTVDVIEVHLVGLTSAQAHDMLIV